MTAIHLAAPGHADVDALLAFELANRAFFESTINARPPWNSRRAVALAIEEAEKDRGYQFLVKSGAGDIVGRVNLSNVRRPHFHSAVLGYRIGESAGGKGYASGAVRQVLDFAFGALGLLRIEADARAENLGSVRVLLRNGFVQFGHSRRSFELKGVWYDRLHFERHALTSTS